MTDVLACLVWLMAGIGIGLSAIAHAKRDAAHFNDPWSNLYD